MRHQAQEETIRNGYRSGLMLKIKRAHRMGREASWEAVEVFAENHFHFCDLCREFLAARTGRIPLTFRQVTALENFREEYRIAREFSEMGGPAFHFLRRAILWKQYLVSIAPSAAQAGNRFLLGRYAA